MSDPLHADVTSDAAPEPKLGVVGRTFSSLRHRNFMLYFVGQMVSNTGNWLTNVALALLVLKITGSGLRVGVLAACQYGPLMIFSPFAGALADRFNKRRSLILTQTLEMAQSAALAVLAFLPHPSLIALYVLAFAGGTFLAFDNPLRRSFVSEMVPPRDLPNAIVLYSTIVNGSRIFGPALAGALIAGVGYGWCFALDAASYLAVLVCLFLMREQELHRVPRRATTRGAVLEGLRYVFNTPALWISFLMFAIVSMVANLNVTLPIFVTRGLHGTEQEFTTLYSISSVGAVVGSLFIANRGFVKLRHVVIGSVAMGVALLLLASVGSVLIAAPMMFVVGLASILFMTATTAIAQVEAKQEMHGRVLALQTVLIGGPLALGGPVLGWIADTLGARAPMAVGGVVSLMAGAIGWWASRRFVKPSPA